MEGWTIYSAFKNKKDIIKKLVKNSDWYPYVSCCDVMHLDHDNFSPFKNWRTIIYSFDEKTKLYNVIGFMSYDNSFDVKSMHKFNHGVCPFLSTLQGPGDDKKLFKLPWFTRPDADSFTGVTTDEAWEYVDGILDETLPEFEDTDIWKFIVVQLSCNDLFYPKWVRYEKMRFMQSFENAGEAWVLAMMRHNNVGLNTVATPTVRDETWFAKTHALAPPTTWFEVPLVEVPSVCGLPIYEGGVVHISYADVKHWLWFKICNTAQQVKTQMYKHGSELVEQFQTIALHANSRLRRHHRKRHKASSGPAGVVDIEEVGDMLPACARSYVTAKRFPLFAERAQLTSILQHGGASLESIGSLLDNLNDKYPHNPRPLETRKRWDYVAYFNKEMYPKNCETLTSCGSCPYDGDKTECIKDFDKRWPQYARSNNIDFLNSPSRWIKWIFYWRNRGS